MSNHISQAELDHLLRRNATKVRSGLRGMLKIMRAQFDRDIPDDTLDRIEATVIRELEAGLDQMKLAIQEGI